MIVRIVRMHFDQEAIDDFLEIYDRVKAAIGTVQGCTYLELLRDTEDPNVFVTISHWERIEDLENYRNSELFKNVWNRVKTLFAQPADAYSLSKANEE